MELPDARALAIAQLQKHGLTKQGWRFGFDQAKRRLGCCNYSKKWIQLSMPLTKSNGYDQVLDTVLHEISHAIAGHKAGHGPVWKEIARKVGAKPERCFSAEEVNMPEGKFHYQCPACRRGISRHRRMESQVACKTCCEEHSGGSFDARFTMIEARYQYLKPGDPIQPGDQYKADDGWKVLTEAEYNKWKGFRDHYDPEEGMNPFRRLVPMRGTQMPGSDTNSKEKRPVVFEIGGALAGALGGQKPPRRVTFTERRKKAAEAEEEPPPDRQEETPVDKPLPTPTPTSIDTIIAQLETEFRPRLAEDDPIRIVLRGVDLALQQSAVTGAAIVHELLAESIKDAREKMAVESRQKLKELNEEMMRYTRNAVSAIQHGRNEANQYLITALVELQSLAKEMHGIHGREGSFERWKQRSIGALIAVLLLAVGYVIGKGELKL
jgi:predicted SprT family Zn-dependent metalloprotease